MVQEFHFESRLEHAAHVEGGDFSEGGKEVVGEGFDEGDYYAGENGGGGGGYLGVGCYEGEHCLVDVWLDVYTISTINLELKRGLRSISGGGIMGSYQMVV